MRAPGMTMFRMPIFTWNTLITAILVIMAFPPLAAALFGLGADRVFGAHIYNPANGGALLWQHLFWFFGHPEVYIIALPFFGIVTEVFPVFSRKPVFGYKSLVFATIAIAALSVTVWAHHMYVTGSVLLPFFSIMSMLIAVPTGVKIFNWVGTMWRGSVTFEAPMLWAIGFLITFTFGGLTGVIIASPPLDFHVSDTYFIVAHFHYIGVRHGRVRHVQRLLLLVAQVDRQDPQRPAGQDPLLAAVPGLPHDVPDPALARRLRDAAALRHLSARGQLHLDESAVHLRFVAARDLHDSVPAQRVHHGAHAPKVTSNDPWGYGRSLEWATSCPPPRHNFTSIPRIRSESPGVRPVPPRGRNPGRSRAGSGRSGRTNA